MCSRQNLHNKEEEEEEEEKPYREYRCDTGQRPSEG